MSINKLGNFNEPLSKPSSGSSFRKAIRLALCASLLSCSPEPVESEAEPFDGIRVVPDNTPIKRIKENKKEPAKIDPLCTPRTCKLA